MLQDTRMQCRADSVFIHPSAYIDQPCTIGRGTRIWHFCHVLPGAVIGRGCTLGQNVMIGRDVRIGDNCKIQNNVSIYTGVELEDEVFCGPSCVFTNVVNPRAGFERKAEFKTTRVGRGATVGANATILCGLHLGDYCFIGAGAVVTQDVSRYGLMVGAPARRTGWISRAGGKLDGDLVCPVDGSRYEEQADGTIDLISNE
jgi:UDP-2-acetamido-3-amino-2,3-dideoxy-glucuronate N-acetyltransferase